MAEATVTSRGRITIPAEIRRRMGLGPRDKVVFTVLPNGTTVVRAKKRSLVDLVGTLRSDGSVGVADMRMD